MDQYGDQVRKLSRPHLALPSDSDDPGKYMMEQLEGLRKAGATPEQVQFAVDKLNEWSRKVWEQKYPKGMKYYSQPSKRGV